MTGEQLTFDGAAGPDAPDGCWCVRFQKDGIGPWVIIPDPRCPVHGDAEAAGADP